MKVLHIIRNNDDLLARRIIEEIQNLDHPDQALLMIQDGVYVRPGTLRAFACADDVRARGVETDLELVDYDRIVEMVFEYDKVITW
jgi:sulfur relay protein TusB/DsrH